MARALVAFAVAVHAAAEGDVVIDERAWWLVDVQGMTSVTIDVCSMKQRLNFSEPRLVAATKLLSPSVIRIGGTDQNTYSYDLSKQRQEHCSCGEWCWMAASYWESVLTFASKVSSRILFGLIPDLENASALINYTMGRAELLGYTFGNEQSGSDVLVSYSVMLRELRRRFGSALFLAAPDTAIGPRHADYWAPGDLQDPAINKSLNFVAAFARETGDVVDVVTWHEYDFRAGRLGAPDRGELPWPPDPTNLSHFYDPVDLATAFDDVARQLELVLPPGTTIWLSETNSINHGGTSNLSDTYANALWLTHRLATASTHASSSTFMATQTLVGYANSSYALLSDDFRPRPAYFALLAFKQLATTRRFRTVSPHPKLTAFALDAKPRGLLIGLVWLDDTADISVRLATRFDLGDERLDFYFTSSHRSSYESAADILTAPSLLLNGFDLSSRLTTGRRQFRGLIHDLAQRAPRPTAPISLSPLTFAYFLFPNSSHLPVPKKRSSPESVAASRYR